MITAVQVDSLELALSPLTFSLGDDTVSYIIKNIDGLGPTDADIKLTEYSDMPGAAFQSAKISKRNILMTIGLNANYATSDPFGTLRRALHRHLGPGRNIKLTFTRDVGPVVYTTGYVEKFEPNIFSDEPQVVISIICPDPYFYNNAATSQSRLTSQGQSLTFSIDNSGDVNAGMVFFIDKVIVGGPYSLWISRVYNSVTATMQISNFVGNGRYVIRLDTTKGHKILDYMSFYEYHNYDQAYYDSDPDADLHPGLIPPYTGPYLGWINGLGYVNRWLDLFPGANTIGVATTIPSGTPPQPDVTLSYIPRYVGL